MITLITRDPDLTARLRDELPPEEYRIDEVAPAAGTSPLGSWTTRPDAIVLDLSGVDIPPPPTCGDVRDAAGGDETTPLIVLQGRMATRSDRIDCLRAGAWDVLTAPDDLGDLPFKLGTFTRIKRELDFAQATSLLDARTQVYNTRGLLLRADELVAVAARYGQPLSCAVFGPPPAGDDLELSDEDLQKLTEIVVSTVRQTCRGSDLVGRLGPSQFAVIAPETGPREAWQMIRRILLETDRQLGRHRLPTERLNAGYWAESEVQKVVGRPADVLVNAAAALRSLGSDEGNERIRLYSADLDELLTNSPGSN